MSLGAQAPIPHQYIPRPSARMDRLPLGEVVREEGRHHQLQAQARAGMQQPQEPRHGNVTPRPRDRWLPKGLLSSRGSRHGASRALPEQRAMAMPSAFGREPGRQRAAEALAEQVKEA